jgi:hypothetical protein
MFQLGFQFGDTRFERRNKFLNILTSVTGRYELGTVPIEGDNFNEEKTLHDSVSIRFGQLPNKFRMLAGIFDSGMAEDLQARALRVIHEKKGYPIVGREIAGGKHLAIAAEIGEGQGGWTEHVQETRPAAAMLHVRPTALRDGRHVKRIAGGNELSFLVREWIMLQCPNDTSAASVVTLLRREN